MKTTAAAAITPPEPGAYPVDIRNENGDVIGHGWMMPQARPSIDHGRLSTLEWREKLASVSATVGTYYHSVAIPPRAIISPRRIYREYLRQTPEAGQIPMSCDSVAGFSIRVADMTFKLLRDWRDEGCPDLTKSLPFTGQVGRWSIKLTQEVVS